MPLTELERGSGLAVAVDLINTWDELEAEPDLLREGAWLQRWLSWHGFPDAAAAIRDADLEPARDLRRTLTAAFDARDEPAAVAILNDLAASSAPTGSRSPPTARGYVTSSAGSAGRSRRRAGRRSA